MTSAASFRKHLKELEQRVQFVKEALAARWAAVGEIGIGVAKVIDKSGLAKNLHCASRAYARRVSLEGFGPGVRAVPRRGGAAGVSFVDQGA